MRLKYLIFASMISSTLYAATSQESLAVQELRLSLEQLAHRLHSHNVELSLFQERALSLENLFHTLKQEIKTSSGDKGLEKRTTALEKAHEVLIADIKTLKNHMNETTTGLSQCQAQLAKIDKQITADIQLLKTSIQSMLALLQGESRSYTVQTGDSLGQIALDHKTDIKTLKKLNQLTSDTIFAGQKIILP